MKQLKYLLPFVLLLGCQKPPISSVTLLTRQGATVPSFSEIQVSWETDTNPGNTILLPAQGAQFPLSFGLVFPPELKDEVARLSIQGLLGGKGAFSATATTTIGDSAEATIEFCGDGVLFGKEECDAGNLNSDRAPNACRSTCVLSFCGDAVNDLADECDDGNGIEGDGCDTNCTPSACGNGILAPGEVCFSLNESLLGLQQPHALLEIDLDQDGLIDLVTSHPESDALRIFRNQGAGNFGLGENLIAEGVTKLSKGDLDQDGDEDLIALLDNGFAATAQVFLNEDGELTPFTSVATAYVLKDILVKDINMDGLLDVVLIDGTASALRIEWGQGDGTFFGEELLSTAGPEPISVDAKDLIGNGLPDLIVANKGNNSVTFIANLSGDFVLLDQFATLSKPVKVLIEDLDGDQDLDIAVAQESGHVRVFKKNALGQFEPLADFPVGSQPSSLVVLDVDLDGDIDLATTNLEENTVSILQNNGFGQFQEPKEEDGNIVRFDTRISPVDLVQGDLNGDGIPDLAVVGQNLGILLANP